MEPTTHKHTLSNGAAHVAYAILVHGLNDPADIWTGGQLRNKLKAAKKTPAALDTEKQRLPNGEEILLPAYQERLETWLESPMGEIVMDEDERETLKSAVQNLAKKDQLSKFANFIDPLTEIIGLLGMSKKR